MPFRGLFFFQALVLAVIGATHYLALEHFLYWHYIWLDVPVHFLGGLWVALSSVWLLAALQLPQRFLWVMVAVLLVGIGWELFEIAIGVPIESNYVFDTSIDMVMDILGGLTGYAVGRRLARS